jgi:hypothetical protein
VGESGVGQGGLIATLRYDIGEVTTFAPIQKVLKKRILLKQQNWLIWPTIASKSSGRQQNPVAITFFLWKS